MRGQLKKGMLVSLTGELQNRKFNDGNGIERFVTEVVVSEYAHTLDVIQKQQTGTQQQRGTQQQQQWGNQNQGGMNNQPSYDYDDIPL